MFSPLLYLVQSGSICWLSLFTIHDPSCDWCLVAWVHDSRQHGECAQKYSQPSRLAPTESGLKGVKAWDWLQLLIKNQFDTLKKEHLIGGEMLHQLLDFIHNMGNSWSLQISFCYKRVIQDIIWYLPFIVLWRMGSEILQLGALVAHYNVSSIIHVLVFAQRNTF